MKKALSFLGVICSVSLLTAGAARAADSGFLPDYSKLENTKDSNGVPVRRWLSPKLTKANYQKVIIDKVVFYPEPQASDQVSDQTLKDIQNYVDTQLRTVALDKVPQVTDPGPGVLRLKLAITAVDTSAAPLKPWQIIPVALVIQGAEAASGHRTRDADLSIESLVTDSVTNEVLGENVRGTKGVTLPNSQAQLTLDVVKSRIDEWAASSAQLVQQKLE
jgi:hypothetical protein